MLRIALIAMMLACHCLAQESKPAKHEVTVVSYANKECPLMTKPVKPDIFVDTSHGRVYLCCKTCLARAKKDPEGTYTKAYPTATKVNNKMDPIDGKPVKDGTTVVYAGHEIALADASHAKAVCANGDIYVTLLTKPEVKDVNNAKDPTNDKPIVENNAVLIGNSLVRLSGPESVEEVKKDPAKALEKAEKSAKADKKGD